MEINKILENEHPFEGVFNKSVYMSWTGQVKLLCPAFIPKDTRVFRIGWVLVGADILVEIEGFENFGPLVVRYQDIDWGPNVLSTDNATVRRTIEAKAFSMQSFMSFLQRAGRALGF